VTFEAPGWPPRAAPDRNAPAVGASPDGGGLSTGGEAPAGSGKQAIRGRIETSSWKIRSTWPASAVGYRIATEIESLWTSSPRWMRSFLRGTLTAGELHRITGLSLSTIYRALDRMFANRVARKVGMGYVRCNVNLDE
jgi:hypothetical protein